MTPEITREAKLFLNQEMFWCEILDERQVDTSVWYKRERKMTKQYLVAYEVMHTEYIAGCVASDFITATRWVDSNKVKKV